MNEIILMSDPKVAAVPVAECGEQLVDARHVSSLLVDDRKQQDSADTFAYLREGVLNRLLTAEASLPQGLRLLFVEGYRPPSLQRRYFEEYAAQLRANRPEWSAGEVRSAASRFVSPPEVAPHSAGAAVDLTLADADGQELNLGTRMNATPEESAGACYTQAANVTDEARPLRHSLSTALTDAELINYPTEQWHSEIWHGKNQHTLPQPKKMPPPRRYPVAARTHEAEMSGRINSYPPTTPQRVVSSRLLVRTSVWSSLSCCGQAARSGRSLASSASAPQLSAGSLS